MNRRAYTLLEMLVVIVILGISAALVVPVVSGGDPLRVQTTVRAAASDIMFAQSDALAYQRRRAIVFDVDDNSYFIAEVSSEEIDIDRDALFKIDGPGQRYIMDVDVLSDNGARLMAADFDGDNVLVFDELGSPVDGLLSTTPSAGGTVDLGTDEDRFRIRVEAYTGRVTVDRLP